MFLFAKASYSFNMFGRIKLTLKKKTIKKEIHNLNILHALRLLNS